MKVVSLRARLFIFFDRIRFSAFIMKLNNKWLSGAIPALLIHCSIGTVYCWSLLKEDIAVSIGCSVASIEWAFSLAIFFLGMSAAFGGNMVEKNVKRSAFLSTFCFTLGMLGTGFAILLKSPLLVLLFYGVIMGIGLGIGYLTPVKTLMMWFSEHKGLATGIAITGFGLAKVIASPIMQFLLSVTTIANLFFILGAGYCFFMILGSLLIKKPQQDELKGAAFSIKDSIKFILNKQFLAIWFVFFINITCGLALISQEKSLVQYAGLGASIAIISSLTAFFNSFGRFAYSTISDKFRVRSKVYEIIFFSSALACVLSLLSDFVRVDHLAIYAACIILMLLVCNAGYGGGFSTLPSLLSDKFGMKNVSVIHGFALSAWAWAGLVGNQMGNYVITHFGYSHLFVILGVLYLLSFFITRSIISKTE